MAKRYKIPEEAIFPVSVAGDSDDKLGWGAAASSILWQTGWTDDALRNAPETPEPPETPEDPEQPETPTEPLPETVSFQNAAEVFEYYKTCFTNEHSRSYFGAKWFFTGEYPVAFVSSQNVATGGGFLQNVDFGEYSFWLPAKHTAQLEKLWPDLTPEEVSAPEEPQTTEEPAPEEPSTVVANYGGLIGGVYTLKNPSDSRTPANGDDIDSLTEVVIVGYETGGDHSAEFGLAPPITKEAGLFPTNTVANPRYVSGFYIVDPNEPVASEPGDPAASEGDEPAPEPSATEPFWVFAKYYPDLGLFRVKPEVERESWNGKERYLCDFFFLLKNPNGKGFGEETPPETGDEEQGTTQ